MKTLLLFLVLTSLTSITFAAEVYTWKDEQGNIHYGDRPLESKDATVLKQKKETNIATLAPKDNQWQQDYQKDKTAKKEEQKKSNNNAKQKSKYCSQLKNRLALFNEGGRIYNRTATGERSFYGDDDIAKEKKTLSAQLKKKCN